MSGWDNAVGEPDALAARRRGRCAESTRPTGDKARDSLRHAPHRGTGRSARDIARRLAASAVGALRARLGNHWDADANALIGPIIGAPPNLPVISFTDRDAKDWTWKLPAVERFVADRPLAWLDDDPGQGADDWAADRSVPTLLVKPDGYVGWTDAECGALVNFARRHGTWHCD